MAAAGTATAWRTGTISLMPARRSGWGRAVGVHGPVDRDLGTHTKHELVVREVADLARPRAVSTKTATFDGDSVLGQPSCATAFLFHGIRFPAISRSTSSGRKRCHPCLPN